MRELPILFNGEMVRAILDGRKTQTRRPVRVDGDYAPDTRWAQDGCDRNWFVPCVDLIARGVDDPIGPGHRCPFGAPGDRLWVRECFATVDLDWRACKPEPGDRVLYRADGPSGNPEFAWRPSIQMPRWASRLTLRVTDVRVERLQDITEADARAEGARRFEGLPPSFTGSTEAKWSMGSPSNHGECLGSARMAFANTWLKAYGTWDANPWVWVVSFEREVER